MKRAQPEGASASIQKVRLRRTDDDAHQTLIARGPRGAPLGAVHSAAKQTGPEVKEFGKLERDKKTTQDK